MAIDPLTRTSLGGCTLPGSAYGGQSGRRALNCPRSTTGAGRDVPELHEPSYRGCGMPVEAGPVRPGGAANASRCESDDHQCFFVRGCTRVAGLGSWGFRGCVLSACCAGQAQAGHGYGASTIERHRFGMGPVTAGRRLLPPSPIDPDQVLRGGLLVVHPSAEGPVELTVPGTVEAVTADPPRGGHQRRDPSQHGEGGLAAHPARMGPPDQQLGGGQSVNSQLAEQERGRGCRPAGPAQSGPSSVW
jgi:hypothetical protein